MSESSTKSPRLVQYIEALHPKVLQLAEITEQLTHLKRLAATMHDDPAAELQDVQIIVRLGLELQVGMPVAPTPEAIEPLLQDMIGQLGLQVIQLWEECHTITSEAAQHCEVARSRSQPAGN